MKNNNFDDFLLDPSHDDLDSLHQDAERQLYKNGGTRADRRIKRNVAKGNLKKADRISARQTKRMGKKASKKIEKGPLTKAIKDTSELSKDQKKAVKVANKPANKPADKPKLKQTPTTKAQEAPQGATNAPGKTKTKRGTGVTYEGAWRDNKGNVKSKYKTYKDFESAAKSYNKKKDAAKANAKPKVKKKDPKLALDAKRGKVTKKEVTKQFPMGFGSKS
tara:strand:- start:39042 stop:39701 length:660 start_codon:yes stop_codon:yes gene_type:complete